MPNGSFALLMRLIFLALLAGCTTSVRAPIVDLSTGAASERSVSVQTVESVNSGTRVDTHTVKQGDTLYSIARASGSSVAALVAWNQISDPTQLRVGQVLTLRDPAVVVVAKPAPVAPTPALQQTLPPPVAATPPVQPPKPEPKPEARSIAVPQAADAKAIQWAWPASGEIIQAFSATSKGIDIAGSPGDPVRAAADGRVMYSGNGVRGLGNLLIINHQNGFITAYAHNHTLLVRTGQDVKRGAKIAEIGQSDTTSPRLHFEVRRQGTPVNPLQYLPQR